MATYTDALRGYAYKVHKRDNFKCRYCGVDGLQSFDVWLTLTLDHLLPKDHPNCNNQECMVTACHFCNTADNRYFDKAEQYDLQFDNLTPDQLVEQRRGHVEKTRHEYRVFWETQVRAKAE